MMLDMGSWLGRSEAKGEMGFILEKGGRSPMTYWERFMNGVALVILWRYNE